MGRRRGCRGRRNEARPFHIRNTRRSRRIGPRLTRVYARPRLFYERPARVDSVPRVAEEKFPAAFRFTSHGSSYNRVTDPRAGETALPPVSNYCLPRYMTSLLPGNTPRDRNYCSPYSFHGFSLCIPLCYRFSSFYVFLSLPGFRPRLLASSTFVCNYD